MRGSLKWAFSYYCEHILVDVSCTQNLITHGSFLFAKTSDLLHIRERGGETIRKPKNCMGNIGTNVFLCLCVGVMTKPCAMHWQNSAFFV